MSAASAANTVAVLNGQNGVALVVKVDQVTPYVWGGKCVCVRVCLQGHNSIIHGD